MSKASKKLGLGSLSLLLCAIGILFVFFSRDYGDYGDILLEFIGLNSWSNGNSGIHYTIFYSLIFFIPSFILGYKFKNNLGAMLGKIVSLIMLILILLVFPILIFMYLYHFSYLP